MCHLLKVHEVPQATYKEAMDKLEKLKEELTPKLKLLKAATPVAPSKAKDEV